MLQRPENNALDRCIQISQWPRFNTHTCTYWNTHKNYVQYASCSLVPRLLQGRSLGTRLASWTVS